MFEFFVDAIGTAETQRNRKFRPNDQPGSIVEPSSRQRDVLAEKVPLEVFRDLIPVDIGWNISLNHSGCERLVLMRSVLYDIPAGRVNRGDSDDRREERHSLFLPEGEHEHALEEKDDKGHPVDTCQGSELEQPKVEILAVSDQTPRKSSEQVGQDVFEGHPYKRDQKIDQPRKHASDSRKRPGEDSPEHRKVTDKQEVDDDTQANRHVCVVCRDGRNPVDKQSVEADAGYKPGKEAGFWRLSAQDEEDRQQGDPGEER